MKSSTKRSAPVDFLSDEEIGLDARAHADDHLDVKIWLRLLACSTQIKQNIRQNLRVRFGTTLARFDYLAQLERHPEGLRMQTLSRYLMVTSGNVTGLTDQLVIENLVERVNDPDDRRSWLIRLTPKGRAEFAEMAAEHERWLIDLFKGIPLPAKEALNEQLARLRVQVSAAASKSKPKGRSKT
jgi:DNA-binding MarR family transcriptional regulator